MERHFKATFRDTSNGDVYRIRFEWRARLWLGIFDSGSGYFRLYAESYPSCEFELGRAAHLLANDEICVLAGHEPRSKERAKAIALLWIRGFGIYCREGHFPNEGGRVNVAEC